MSGQRNKKETDLILETVSVLFSCPVEILIGRGRSRDLADARHVAMSVIRAVMRFTFAEIGTVFKKDHSTVVHAIQKVDRSKILQNKALEVVKEYRAKIKNHPK